MSAGDAAGPSRDAARAGVTQAGTPPHRVTTTRPTTVVPTHRARRDCPRPDRWTLYPDPAHYLTMPTLYGLTVDQYRAEWCRCQAAGWMGWELAARFPCPESVAA